MDLSGKTYMGLALSLLLGVCGEYLFVCLSKALCELNHIKKLLMLFGVESLLVLFIHYEDFIIVRNISIGYGAKFTLLRLLIVIPTSLIIILIKNSFKKDKQ